MRRSLFLASATLLLSFTAAAHADSTFTFTLTSDDYNGSGTLTGVDDPLSDVYDLTSASGTINGTAISLFFTPGLDSSHFATDPDSLQNYDNVIYMNGSPVVDLLSGVLFTVGAGRVRVFYDGSCCGIDVGSIGGVTDNAVFTVTPATAPPAVPEPSSFVLLGTGVLTFAGAARRRFLKA